METDRTVTAASQTSPLPVSRPKTHRQPQGLDGHFIRAADRHWLGISSPGDGLRVGHDLLAASSRLAKGGYLGQDPSGLVEQTPRGRQDRLLTSRRRQRLSTGAFWGAKTGPNPTDRRKSGSKHHVITDANGIPLAVTLTGANRHDVTQLLPLVNAIPAIAGQPGRPRYRPDCVQGDRGYDSEPHRQALRQVGIQPILAKSRTEHGSALGIFRWVVERTLSWLHQKRRLRIRYERRDDIHEAFLTLGCILICHKCLTGSFC